MRNARTARPDKNRPTRRRSDSGDMSTSPQRQAKPGEFVPFATATLRARRKAVKPQCAAARRLNRCFEDRLEAPPLWHAASALEPRSRVVRGDEVDHARGVNKPSEPIAARGEHHYGDVKRRNILLAQPISGAVFTSWPTRSRFRRLGRHSSSRPCTSEERLLGLLQR